MQWAPSLEHWAVPYLTLSPLEGHSLSRWPPLGSGGAGLHSISMPEPLPPCSPPPGSSPSVNLGDHPAPPPVPLSHRWGNHSPDRRRPHRGPPSSLPRALQVPLYYHDHTSYIRCLPCLPLRAAGTQGLRLRLSNRRPGSLPAGPKRWPQLHPAWGRGDSPRLGEARVICDPAVLMQALFQVFSKYQLFVMTSTRGECPYFTDEEAEDVSTICEPTLQRGERKLSVLRANWR